MHDGQIELTLREDRGALRVVAHGGTRAILDGPEEAWEGCGELLALHGDPPPDDGNPRVALRRSARGRFCVTPMTAGAEPVVCRDAAELWSALLGCVRYAGQATALARVEQRPDRGRSRRRAEPVEIIVEDDEPVHAVGSSRPGGLVAGLIGDLVGARYGSNAGLLAQGAAQRFTENVNARRNAVPASQHKKQKSSTGKRQEPERHIGACGPRRMVKPKCDPILGIVDWGGLKRT